MISAKSALTPAMAPPFAVSGPSDALAAEPPWHALAADESCVRLDVSPERGLDPQEVETRRGKWGANELQAAAQRSLLGMVLGQFTDALIIILLGAAAISGWIGELADTVTILVIVLLNATIGVVQEYRAERAVAELKKLSSPHAKVLRGGRVEIVTVGELVPGDVLTLEAGDLVPADVRLIRSAGLEADESALTGESQPVTKQERALIAAEAALGDRSTMLFKGTLVTRGRGTAVTVATGMRTQLGQIADLLGRADTVQTPLQRRLAQFGHRLAWAVLILCAVVFLAGLMRGEPVLLMFLTALSLAVAAIPEALPAVVTVGLALGAGRMASIRALVRRLPAVETLGSVTYICSDKTGTLTQNCMRVETLAYGDTRCAPSALRLEEAGAADLVRALILNNDAQERGGNVVGDPTEAALLQLARDAGLNAEQLRAEAPRVAELPFDADRKMMTTWHRDGPHTVAYTKGSPEAVLSRCQFGASHQERDSARWLGIAESMAAEGYRVLAVARRHWDHVPDAPTPEAAERALELVGLVGLVDPPRPEAAEAVAECIAAGIVPVMITGDHAATARAIAERLGILTDKHGTVMRGDDLAQLSSDEFARTVGEVRVYARVTPQQKIDIVRALQARGEFVAMTGDGVNDAPALKRADIGVSMGARGTDVAREASQLVLLDDNFATIVRAVREGRRIYDNIRKFVRYVITGNAGEIWTLFLAPFFGLPLPLLPIHILWVNLVTDGLPGLALTAEAPERGVMRRPPRHPQESLFAHGLWQHALWVGLLIGGLALFTQAWAMSSGSPNWQTMTFTVLTFCQLVQLLAIRSERESIFSVGIFANRWLLATVVGTVLLQLVVIYSPTANAIFKTTPLTAEELLFVCTVPWLVLFGVELEKWAVRKGMLYRVVHQPA